MKRPFPRPWFASVIVLSLWVLPVAGADPGAELFNELCAVCHTVDGGDGAGPDLLPSTKQPRVVLRLAVERMQDNTGPLTAEQIDTITDLLLDPTVKVRLTGGDAPPEAEAEVPSGSPDTGLRLFFGQEKFANHGSPCFACHSIAGRGGNLAVDLTSTSTRMSEKALASAMEKPAYPLMKVEYGRHPLTAEEARHIAAFLAQGAAATTASVPPDEPLVLYGAAAGFAALIFSGVALVSRRHNQRGGSR